jgi:hypothetical protein
MARIDGDAVGQREQALQGRVELARQPRRGRSVPRVQVGPADVADEQRVAGEDQPRLLRAAAPVRDNVGVVSRRMAGRRDRSNDGVTKLDGVTVTKGAVLELDRGAVRQIRRRTRSRDELGQPGDVVGLNVRLEDRYDRRADSLSSARYRSTSASCGSRRASVLWVVQPNR